MDCTGYYLQLPFHLRICSDVGLDGALTTLATGVLAYLAWRQMQQLAAADANRAAEKRRFALARAAIAANSLRRQLQSWITEAEQEMLNLVELSRGGTNFNVTPDQYAAAARWVLERARREHLDAAEAHITQLLLDAAEAEDPEAYMRAVNIRSVFQSATGRVNRLASALTKQQTFVPEQAVLAYTEVQDCLMRTDLFLELAAPPQHRPTTRT